VQGLRLEFAQYVGTPRPPEKQDLRSSSRFLASGRSRFCIVPEPATFAITAHERTANASAHSARAMAIARERG
jgi:hypothetical protein